MDQEVFKTNFFMAIILPIIITVVILSIYLIADGVPTWVLALLIIPVFFAFAGYKTKLIVENGMLRYIQVFGFDEVSLNKVSKIVIREVEAIVNINPDSFNNNQSSSSNRIVMQRNQERRVEKFFYLLDESGRTIFTFPANLIEFRDRRRFEEAVTYANPNIELF